MITGILHAVIDFWLNLARIGVLVALTPLLVPALLLRWVGSGTTSALLTAALLPFMATWVVAKNGYHFLRALAGALLTLPYEIVVMPYRIMRALTKPHPTGPSKYTP